MGFAILGAALAFPLSLVVKWPVKLLVEWPTKAIENYCLKSKNPVVQFVGHGFGLISSLVRYTVSLNPIQSAKEAAAPSPRLDIFGKKWGPRVAKVAGFLAGVLSLGGIAAIAFGGPTAIVGAAQGINAVIPGAINIAAMTAALNAGPLGAMSQTLSVVNAATIGGETAGLGAMTLAVSVTTAAQVVEEISRVGVSTAGVSKRLGIIPSQASTTKPIAQEEKKPLIEQPEPANENRQYVTSTAKQSPRNRQ